MISESDEVYHSQDHSRGCLSPGLKLFALLSEADRQLKCGMRALSSVRGLTWNELPWRPCVSGQRLPWLFRSGGRSGLVCSRRLIVKAQIASQKGRRRWGNQKINHQATHSMSCSMEECCHEISQSCSSSRFISLSRALLASDDDPSSLPLQFEASSIWLTDWKMDSLRPSRVL